MATKIFFLCCVTISSLAHGELGSATTTESQDGVSSHPQDNTDPCIGFRCQTNSECHVEDQQPVCKCSAGYMFNLMGDCVEKRCGEKYCGPYSNCEMIDDVPQCTCKYASYPGPPGCLAECTVDDDCNFDQACDHGNCIDPCLSKKCGANQVCKVSWHHKPMCECSPGYSYDSFGKCWEGWCSHELCGDYASCKMVNDIPQCTCEHGGEPPNCRPQCNANTDCAPTQACENHVCTDPCLSKKCEDIQECYVENHEAMCRCPTGYNWNWPDKCWEGQCSGVLCGHNSDCKMVDGAPKCSCPHGKHWGFYCYECSSNADCPYKDGFCDRGYCRSRCKDLYCGVNEECHIERPFDYDPFDMSAFNSDPFEDSSIKAICKCTTGYYNSSGTCVKTDCSHTNWICGENFVCKMGDNGFDTTCKCKYGGDNYYNCRPQCEINAHCRQNQKCSGGLCVSACYGGCPENEECATSRPHTGYCRCKHGFARYPDGECK